MNSKKIWYIPLIALICLFFTPRVTICVEKPTYFHNSASNQISVSIIGGIVAPIVIDPGRANISFSYPVKDMGQIEVQEGPLTNRFNHCYVEDVLMPFNSVDAKYDMLMYYNTPAFGPHLKCVSDIEWRALQKKEYHEVMQERPYEEFRTME